MSIIYAGGEIMDVRYLFTLGCPLFTLFTLAPLVQPNHILNLCSGPSRICRRRVSSSVLGIRVSF